MIGSRAEQTSPRMAKVFVRALLGDRDATSPEGTPFSTYFALMDLHSAHRAYEEVYQLPEGFRERDLVERLGEDGRA